MSAAEQMGQEGAAASRAAGMQSEQPPTQRLPDVMQEILACNSESEGQEDLWSRTRLAADQVRQAEADAREADSNWANADLNHKALQAEYPERPAPRPRQWLIAAGTLMLDGVACYFAAETLGGSPAETFAWAGLFLALLGAGELTLDLYRETHRVLWRWTAFILGAFIVLLGLLRFWFLATVGTYGLVTAAIGASLFTLVTAGFVVIGYRALRVAETALTWMARRRAQACAKAAAQAHRRLSRLKALRDRLARAYLSRIRVRLIKTCTAAELPLMEHAVLAHLTGQELS